MDRPFYGGNFFQPSSGDLNFLNPAAGTTGANEIFFYYERVSGEDARGGPARTELFMQKLTPALHQTRDPEIQSWACTIRRTLRRCGRSAVTSWRAGAPSA